MKVAIRGGRIARIMAGAMLTIVLVGMTTASLFGTEVGVHVFTSGPLIVFWDPSEGISDEKVVFNNVYETLLRYDPATDTFDPILAESYEASEDHMTWTFHIRQGIKFHTGNELDAYAVKASIDRTIEGERGAYYIWNAVDRIDVTDKYTVVFHLKYPAPLDLSAAGTWCAWIFDPTVADRDWFYDGNEAGTGPYVIEGGNGDTEVVISRFEDYWGGWEGDHFDTVVFKVIEEESTRLQMMKAGQIDFLWTVSPDQIADLEADDDVEVVVSPAWLQLIACYNNAKTSEHPISNVAVRKALSHSIPYADILEGVFAGYARQPRGIVPYGLWGWSEDVFQYTTDLDAARDLLVEAGYPGGGFSLLVTHCSGDEIERRTAELWKAELAKIGVDLQIRTMPWDSQVALSHAADPNDRQDIFIQYMIPSYAHPHSFLQEQFQTLDPPGFNWSYYANPVFDDLILQAEVAAGTSRSEGAALYVDAQNILQEDAAGIGIADMMSMQPISADIGGFEQANPAYPDCVFWYELYRK